MQKAVAMILTNTIRLWTHTLLHTSTAPIAGTGFFFKSISIWPDSLHSVLCYYLTLAITTEASGTRS